MVLRPLCGFHYPLCLSSFTPTSFLPFLPCFILLCVLGLCFSLGFLGLYCLLLFLHRLGNCLGRSSCPSSLFLLFLSCPWACWMSFLPCWPIKFITSSFGFPWTLLYFYLLLCPWVCWLSFLSCWPIGFTTSFLGLPQLIYIAFATYCAYGPVGYHSCHGNSLDLLPLFLGFHGPFTLLLPFIVPIDLLAVILAVLAHWIYYLFS